MIKKISSSSKIFFLIILTFFSCQKIEEIIPTESENTKITHYTIKEGQHSSTQSFSQVNIAELKFSATFDNSAIYYTKDKSNQEDINKLYGISDCNSHHHQNSARFGWRWLNNQLEIHAYTYVSGKRYSKYITSVALNEGFTYGLQLAAQQYIFTVNDVTVSMERSCEGNASGYKLYPYFGGDETAPHDITIAIKEQK